MGYSMKRNKAICGARTRKGTPCQCQPVPGKRRCKLHGGLSTGPKTAEGRQRSLEALARGRKAEISAIKKEPAKCGQIRRPLGGRTGVNA